MKYSLITLGVAALIMLVAGDSQSKPLTDPYEILKKYYDALGGPEKVKVQKSSYVEGELVLEGTGLAGTFAEWTESPLKSRQEVDLKIITQVTGDNGEYAWMVDRNGKVLKKSDDKTLNDRKLKKLKADFDHLNPLSEVFTLTYEGIDTAMGKDCYVVKTANTLNKDVDREYFDTTSFLLLKTVTVSPENESHAWYSDYRNVDGVLTSYKQELVQIPPGMKQVMTITTTRTNEAIDPAKFEPPGTDVQDFRFTDFKKAAAVPFKFIENHIYLPVTMQGETKLWILDTGAGSTTIDEDYAKKLGLKLEGQVKGQGAGNLVNVSFTTLPPLTIPGLEFDKQSAAVIKVSDLFRRWIDMEVVGILGYDFLSRLVTKVDYANSMLSFYHPDSFNYSGNGVILPAPISERKMPDLPVTVDGKYTGQWSLDLGAGGMSFHYQFAQEHGLLDTPGIDGLGHGAGGSLPQRRILPESIEFAGFKLNNIETTVPLSKGEGAFGNTDLTGNIGNTLLKHFVLYIDYKREQVIVEKGADFERVFPRDNSGMQVFNMGKDSIQVHTVSENTPAAKAGFKVDDLIVAVDGKSINEIGGITGMCALLRGQPGTVLNVEVARGNDKKKLKLTLQDLFN